MINSIGSSAMEVLNKLFKERIEFSNRHADWYRRKKRSRQRVSLSIRLIGVVLLVAGGIWPQIVAIKRDLPPQAGYILLAFSAGLFLVDRVFGASSNWQRYIVAALEIEAKREIFTVRWNQLQAIEPSQELLTQKSFVLALEFTEQVEGIVLNETNSWVTTINQEIKQLPIGR